MYRAQQSQGSPYPTYSQQTSQPQQSNGQIQQSAAPSYSPADYAMQQQLYQQQNSAAFRANAPFQQNGHPQQPGASYSPMTRPITASSSNMLGSHQPVFSMDQQLQSPVQNFSQIQYNNGNPMQNYPPMSQQQIAQQQMNAQQQMANAQEQQARAELYRRNAAQANQQQQQQIQRPHSAASNSAQNQLKQGSNYLAGLQAQAQGQNPFLNQNATLSGQYSQQQQHTPNSSSPTMSQARPPSVNSQRSQHTQNNESPTLTNPTPPGPANFFNSESFVQKVREHLQSIGQPMDSLPQIEGRTIDLARLFQMVSQNGGHALVSQRRIWSWITTSIGFPTSGTSPTNPVQPVERSQAVHDVYQRYLASFEAMVAPQLAKRAAAPSTPQAQASNLAQANLQKHQPQVQPVVNGSNQNALPPDLKPPKRQKSAAQGKTSKAEELAPAEEGESEEPVASTSNAVAPKLQEQSTDDVKPELTKKRKQLVQYAPLAERMSTYGGYTKELVTAASQKHIPKRRRIAQDLGIIETHRLVMSLRSGVPSEIVYGLNTLSLASEVTRTTGREQGAFALSVASLDDLLTVLLDLLEETAFPVRNSDDGKRRISPKLPTSYLEHYSLVLDENLYSRGPRKAQAQSNEALSPADIVLSVVNLLRMFSQTPENLDSFSQDTRLIELTLRLCRFPSFTKDPKLAPPINLSHSDLLTIRKDALVILSELGPDISLDGMPQRCTQSIWELVRFFSQEVYEQDNPLLGNGISAKAEVRCGACNTWSDLAVTVFAQVAVSDANREMFSRAIRSQRDLLDYFETLVRCLPVTDEDLMATLQGRDLAMSRLERMAMALFNLAFVAPYETRQKMRRMTGFPSLVRRSLSRVAMLTGSRHPQDCWTAWLRCLEVVQLISSDSTETDTIDPTAAFFGGGFADETTSPNEAATSFDMARQTSDNSVKKQLSRAPPLYTHSDAYVDLTMHKLADAFPGEVMSMLAKLSQ